MYGYSSINSKITKCNDENEFAATIMRFKAMSLMERMYMCHRGNWEILKTELAQFIQDCKAKCLTDPVSEGLITNLEN